MERAFRTAALGGVALAILLAGAAPVRGQQPTGRTEFNNVGNRAGEFLTIPVGSRAVALGNAYSAIADDITAIYWNPAGLAFMEGTEAFFTVVDMPVDVTLTYAAGASPVFEGTGVIGGFVEVLNLGDIEQTTVLRPNGTGIFWSAFSFAGGVSYAHNFSDRFSAGVSVKGVHEDIFNVTAGGIGFDVGSNYHTTFRGKTIRLAFAVQNLGSSLKFSGSRLRVLIDPPPEGEGEVPVSNKRDANLDTDPFSIPTTFKAGLAYALLSGNGGATSSWLVAGEFQQPNNQDATFSAGTEYTRRIGGEGSATAVSGRGGWYIQQDEQDLQERDRLRGLSLGGGVLYDFGSFQGSFDYAFRDWGRLTNNHFFSVRLSF